MNDEYHIHNDSRTGDDVLIENISRLSKEEEMGLRDAKGQGAKTYLVTCKAHAVSLINISRCITYSVSGIKQSRLLFGFQCLLFHLSYRRMVRQKPWTYRPLSREPQGAIAT